MIDIKATSTSPRIAYRTEDRTLEIIGESYPENSFEFFAPLFSWLDARLKDPAPLKVEIDISYMNSSSTKCVLDLLDMLEEAHGGGREVSVSWFYDDGNDRALDLAEEFKEDVKLPFAIIPRTAGTGI